MKTKKFVQVSNKWLTIKDGDSFASRLNHKRFFLHFLLQVYRAENNMTNTITIQISSISEEYGYITGFKKSANIRSMLVDLKELGLIECDDLDNKTKPSKILKIIIEDFDIKKHDGFQMISIDLFYDNIKLIKSQGLIVYCLLFKLHNIGLGGCTSDGYAEVSREYISKCTGISDIKTISSIVKTLQKAKSLIRIIKSHKRNDSDALGNGIWCPNRYIVFPKFDKGNKYYIKDKILKPLQ